MYGTTAVVPTGTRDLVVLGIRNTEGKCRDQKNVINTPIHTLTNPYEERRAAADCRLHAACGTVAAMRLSTAETRAENL